MKGENIRKRAAKVQPADDVASIAMDALDAAMEQIVRIECAEARSHELLRKMEATIASCLAQADAGRDIQSLFTDYAEMDEMMFLEQAFRDDERDRAMSVIAESQKVLEASRKCDPDRRDMALALLPEHIETSARMFARLSDRSRGYTGLV